jgi:hypothetical protein
MCFLGNGANRFQLRFWIDETLVAAGDIVVRFNSEDARFLGVGYDLAGIVGCESVGADSRIVRPVLLGCLGSSPCGRKNKEETAAIVCRCIVSTFLVPAECGRLNFNAGGGKRRYLFMNGIPGPPNRNADNVIRGNDPKQ